MFAKLNSYHLVCTDIPCSAIPLGCQSGLVLAMVVHLLSKVLLPWRDAKLKTGLSGLTRCGTFLALKEQVRQLPLGTCVLLSHTILLTYKTQFYQLYYHSIFHILQ